MKTSVYYWRNLRCDGCSLACRYKDFKVFDRTGFVDIQQSLFVASENPEDWRYKRKGTVLGIMHKHKLELWGQHTSSCPNYGITDEQLTEAGLTKQTLLDDMRPAPLDAERFVDAMDDFDLLCETQWGNDEVPF